MFIPITPCFKADSQLFIADDVVCVCKCKSNVACKYIYILIIMIMRPKRYYALLRTISRTHVTLYIYIYKLVFCMLQAVIG